VPKVKNRALSTLTPNSELKTPNYFWTQINTDEHRFYIFKTPKTKDLFIAFIPNYAQKR
jgi:hypothetical protein